MRVRALVAIRVSRCEAVEPPGPDGTGRVVELLTKGRIRTCDLLRVNWPGGVGAAMIVSAGGAVEIEELRWHLRLC